jgi:hypothetical protein
LSFSYSFNSFFADQRCILARLVHGREIEVLVDQKDEPRTIEVARKSSAVVASRGMQARREFVYDIDSALKELLGQTSVLK